MSDTVYIHVGIEKTGSTYLQNLVQKNKRLLKKNGMHWVQAGLESGHHYWLAKALDFKYKRGYIHEAKELSAIQKLKEEVKAHAGEELLLSSEHFDFNVGIDNARSLVELFHDRHVVVILCLRSQIDYCQSLYIEHLKWGGVQDFETFINRTVKQDRYNYLRRYDIWQAAGAEVRVIDYDANRVNLAEVFFRKIDKIEIFDLLADIHGDDNFTPSIDFMEFIRLINAGVAPEKRRFFYEQMLSRVKTGHHLLKKRNFPFPVKFSYVFDKESSNNMILAKKVASPERAFLGGDMINKYNQSMFLDKPNADCAIKYFLHVNIEK